MRCLVQKLQRFIGVHTQSRSICGVFCDIDGVLLRGAKLLPGATESVKTLTNSGIPVIFLTNQGLYTEVQKAADLSKILGTKVRPEQLVLSHSPLRHCSVLHNKFVLVLGQQNVKETAKSVGFENICEIEDVKAAYPLLDMVDKSNRNTNAEHPKKLPQIEGIILLGESIRWETQLQLVIDLLISHGLPTTRPHSFPKEHIPIVACNTDLLWMAEAPMPRFGHGTFLMCLEALYKKITGNVIKYTMISGKPFLFTFQYAEIMMRNYLQEKYGTDKLDRIYVIGDNPDTDIYGANIYRDDIQVKTEELNHVTTATTHNPYPDVLSILVDTGVYSKHESLEEIPKDLIHVHKNITFDPNLRKPDYTVANILKAVELIINNESNLLHNKIK